LRWWPVCGEKERGIQNSPGGKSRAKGGDKRGSPAGKLLKVGKSGKKTKEKKGEGGKKGGVFPTNLVETLTPERKKGNTWARRLAKGGPGEKRGGHKMKRREKKLKTCHWGPECR